MDTGQGNWRLAALVFGTALGVSAFAWWMSLAPRPLPADAAPDKFSAYRAIEHIRQTAVEPHPGGSHANERLYEYIVAQLKAMGVETVVDRPIMSRFRTIERNGAILARITGTASTGAFAIDAHFDSTPYGPGAADDLSGVAAMLETIRALKSSPPLRNDIVFCFADKEEMGGDGGPGVFMRHPWFKDVRAILGLETRGTSGPALMFETGPDNGFLIRQLAQSEAQPRAGSVMFDFYSRMPFGSDFDKYKRKKLPGLNVAYIDDFAYYHTKLDNPENVSLASLQHHGCYTLGLARQLGDIPIDNCRGPNVIYFNTIGSHMVVYPYSWGKPISLAAVGILAVVLAVGLARRRLTITGILMGMGLYLAAALLSLLITIPVAALMYFCFREYALYRDDSLSAAIILLGLGILVLLARLVRNRIRPQNLLAGALIWWALQVVALEYFVSYGSYLAAWPLASMSFGLFLLCLSHDRERPSNGLLAAAALTVLPGVVLLTPMYFIFSYAVTPLMTPVLLMFVLLLFAAFVPQMYLISSRIHTVSGTISVAAGVALFAWACITNTPSPERPRQDCLCYAVNFDTGEACWFTSDEELDEWTSTFFEEDSPRGTLSEFLGYEYGRRDHRDEPQCRRAPAPLPPFGKADLRLLDDRTENGRRKLRFFLDSPRDAQDIYLRVESDIPVYDAKAFGINLKGARKNWGIHFDTIPFEGGELEIETDPGRPVRFRVHETSFELPDIPGLPPRPPHLMAQTNRILNRHAVLPTDRTYSVCTYTF